MIGDLLLPGLILMALGFFIPRWLFPHFPEGVRPLVWLGVTAFAILLALSVAAFIVAYLAQGLALADIFAGRLLAGVWHFLRLGLLSGLFWLPVMILSVAQLPAKWKDEVW